MNYGYVRVSTKEQCEDRQLLQMKQLNIESKNIYIDKISGKDFNRMNYKKMIRKIKEKDVIYITSIDRLGRNYEEIIEQWQYITKEKKANIVILDMPLLDTRSHKDITGTLIADIVLQLLSYVAEIERDNIRKRQKEGIVAAKLKGTKFGRPNKKRPNNYNEVKEEYENRQYSLRNGAKQLGVSHSTFRYWMIQDSKKR